VAGYTIFAVPLLVLLLGLPTSSAMGIALASVSISAIYGSTLQRKSILWAPAGLLALGGTLTAPAGKYLANQLPEALLLMGFTVLALGIAIQMWRSAQKRPELSHFLRAKTSKEPAHETTPCKLNPSGQLELGALCLSGLALS
jgi:uncharacterized membrane protein YfcA